MVFVNNGLAKSTPTCVNAGIYWLPLFWIDQLFWGPCKAIVLVSCRIHWLLASLISSTVKVGFVFSGSLLWVLAAFKSLINFRLRAVPLNSFVALLDCLQSIAPVNLGSSSFQLFLQSSGLYVSSFWARAFTPLHLSLFSTSFCRSCNI